MFPAGSAPLTSGPFAMQPAAAMQDAMHQISAGLANLDIAASGIQGASKSAAAATTQPSDIPIQRFCELLDALELRSDALEQVDGLVKREKAQQAAKEGKLKCTPQKLKDLPPECQLELAQLMKLVFPIMQSMDERMSRYFLLTRCELATKGLMLTLAILRRQHELLNDAEPQFIVNAEEVRSMMSRMEDWAKWGISLASACLEKAANAPQTSQK